MNEQRVNDTIAAVKKLTECDVVIVNAHLDTETIGRERRYCEGYRDITNAGLQALVDELEGYRAMVAAAMFLKVRAKGRTFGLIAYADGHWQHDHSHDSFDTLEQCFQAIQKQSEGE